MADHLFSRGRRCGSARHAPPLCSRAAPWRSCRKPAREGRRAGLDCHSCRCTHYRRCTRGTHGTRGSSSRCNRSSRGSADAVRGRHRSRRKSSPSMPRCRCSRCSRRSSSLGGRLAPPCRRESRRFLQPPGTGREQTETNGSSHSPLQKQGLKSRITHDTCSPAWPFAIVGRTGVPNFRDAPQPAWSSAPGPPPWPGKSAFLQCNAYAVPRTQAKRPFFGGSGGAIVRSRARRILSAQHLVSNRV